MSESEAHGMETDEQQEINAEDVEGAQEAPPEQQQHDEPMAPPEGPPDFDTVLRQFMQLSHTDQELFAVHVPAPLDVLKQLRQSQLTQSTSARMAERTMPPLEPKYDGSTNWDAFRIRLLQWLTACGTPIEWWGQRALACLSGAASEYVHSEIQARHIGYYDMAIDPSLFSWQLFDSLMRSGNFGSPPTDDSVRNKLQSFQQLRYKGQYNTAQHLSKVLLILNEAPHPLDDHTAIWLIRRTLYPALQQKVQLTAEDKPFESLQQFLAAVRQLAPVTDREEHEARAHQQQQQQRQAGYKRPFYGPAGPGAAANPDGGSSSGGHQGHPPAAAGGQAPGSARGPPQQQQRQQQQGPSPHVGKPTFNPSLSPAEVARRKQQNRCFHCNAPMGRLENHTQDCKWRRERVAAAKRKASA